jgi:hypothetical protein
VQIAVRIQAAVDIIQMTEMGGENGADLPNRTIRPRAGDGQATQFEADYDADPAWSAAPLPLSYQLFVHLVCQVHSNGFSPDGRADR